MPPKGQPQNFEDANPTKQLLLLVMVLVVLFGVNRWNNNCYLQSGIYAMQFTYYGVEKRVLTLPSGEEVLQIDDVPVLGKSPENLVQLLRGKPGSKIKILVEPRGTEDMRIVEQTRSQNSNFFQCPLPMTSTLLDTQAGIVGVSINGVYKLELRDGEIGLGVGAVNDNSPAEKAGLQAGDFIIGIDGVTLKTRLEPLFQKNASQNELLDAVLSKVRGYPGTPVKIHVVRQLENQQLHEFDLVAFRMLDPSRIHKGR